MFRERNFQLFVDGDAYPLNVINHIEFVKLWKDFFVLLVQGPKKTRHINQIKL